MYAGYKTISLSAANISAEGVKINGVYNEFEGTRKVVLLTDFTMNSVETNEFFINPYHVGNAFHAELVRYVERTSETWVELVVSDDDTVKIITHTKGI